MDVWAKGVQQDEKAPNGQAKRYNFTRNPTSADAVDEGKFMQRNSCALDVFTIAEMRYLKHQTNKIMITRVWHGRTSLEKADYYLEFLLHRGTEDYKKVKGNVSVKVWRRLDAECAHFYTVTEWDSIASIKQFAGEEYEKAVYYPEDQGILLEFESNVRHYESFTV